MNTMVGSFKIFVQFGESTDKKMSADPPFSRFYVYYIIIWIAIWLPMRYYTPLTFTVRHTYELPTAACTGTLQSDFDAFETVREGLFEFLLLVPFTICFMVWSREIIGWRIHVLTAILGLLWSIIMFCFDIRDMIFCNVAPNDPNFNIANLARDARYCLVYSGQPGTELLCTAPGPCSGVAIDASTLMVNGPFTYRFGLNLLLLIMIGYSFFLSYIWKKKMIDEPEAEKIQEPQKIKYISRFETEIKK